MGMTRSSLREIRGTMKAIWITAVASGVLLMAGCGKWPPVTNTAKDVLRLPESTVNIRARAFRDEDFGSLRHLQQLRYLDFYGGWKVVDARFSDRGLATLASLNLPQLQSVFFGYCTNLTDASLVHIRKLKAVTVLGFVACPGITDNGLRTLAEMKGLRELDLRGCPSITDKGLEYLAAKADWQRVEFGGCPQVSLGAVSKLKQKYPTARIIKDDQEWGYETK